MDTIMGVAQVATNMKTMSLHTEASLKVMKMAMNVAEQEGASLMKMIDTALTGLGQNLDMIV